MARYPNARRIKIHRNYTVEQISRVLGVHKHTVRRWEKSGLQAIDDDERPKLFRGPEVHRFLGEQRQNARRPCRPGHLFCFRCREPKLPFDGSADLLPLSASLASLCGMCGCGTLMYRRVSHRTFHTASRNLVVTIPLAHSRIGEKACSTLNADFTEIWRPYAKSQPEK